MTTSQPIPRVLTTKEGQPVKWDGVCLSFRANFDIDCDGSGGNPDGDPDFQAETSYKPHGVSINPYKVPGGVLPLDLFKSVKGAFLGCLGRCTNLKTGIAALFICHDGGPKAKTGEGTPELAKRVGLDGNARHGGMDSQDCLWEFFPGVPGYIDGITYPLQPLA
jgi:hypothetical protein